MRVLVACEYSGRVRDAFIVAGHDAMSCDLMPTDAPGPHYQGDVLDVLDDGWDLMIAHPPCTYLCGSGLHWNKRRLERAQMTEDALAFVRLLLGAPVPRIALENPVGVISTRIRRPDQIIQPYQFGDDASKATCLWLKGLAPLTPTKYAAPRITAAGKRRWGNQTDRQRAEQTATNGRPLEAAQRDVPRHRRRNGAPVGARMSLTEFIIVTTALSVLVASITSALC